MIRSNSGTSMARSSSARPVFPTGHDGQRRLQVPITSSTISILGRASAPVAYIEFTMLTPARKGL
jgi:hypothetical protein